MKENFKIGIIGGAGKMGRLFQGFFEKKGYEVLISDKEEGLSLEELLARAKVIFLSLPMEVFPQMVQKISPFVDERHWILDICSLKLEPSKTMKKYLKKGELLATHPLFGPYEEDLKGKTWAIYPLRGKNLYRWFCNLLADEGIKWVKISPKRHDQIMAIVQVLNHFWLVLLGKVLYDCGISPKEILNLSTPSFLAQLQILSRLAKQDANLYARIQLENPFGKRIRKLLCHNCNFLERSLDPKNPESYWSFVENFKIAQIIAKELEELFSMNSPKEKGASCNHSQAKDLSHGNKAKE